MSTHGQHNYISAHALHPDGRTIFVSVKNATYGKHLGTFSLDMESGAWTCRTATGACRSRAWLLAKL